MGIKEKYLDVITAITTDGFKIIDKQDLLKDFMNDNDEFLSATSWGSLVKFIGKKSFEISDLDEAYHFAIYTAYTNTALEALAHFDIKINNLAIPNISKTTYPCKDFSDNNFLENKLISYFHDSYKKIFLNETLSEEEIRLLQKYINNNLKLNYFKLLDENPVVLSSYMNYLNSDIFIEERNNFKKELYKVTIEKEYLDIVLKDDKGLTLQDLYIEPYFRIHRNCLKENDTRIESSSQKNEKFINIEEVSIHTFIESILNKKNTLDIKNEIINTIFISGFPGQGKSSFVKRFIYDAINEKIFLEKDVIVIKLKNIKDPKSLLDNEIEETIKNQIPFEVESLAKYIIVLDGLDELYMKSGLNLSNIDTICSKFSRFDATTIITTRHHYVDFDKMNENNILIVELKELDKVQQKKWLSKYKKVHSNIVLTESIIEQLHAKENKIKNKHILELINQPILLHMIASMNIEKIEEYDKNKLYKEFFDILIRRKWDKDQHTLLVGMEEAKYEKLLRNMLQELAINIFQSEYEYIHRMDFERLGSVKKFKDELEKIQSPSVHDGLKGVMIAFYFQEVKKDGKDNIKEKDEDYAIEFLHKSLMEYMVAEYIWEEMQIFLDYNERADEYFINDNKQALEIIWKLFSFKMLSHEVLKNLTGIIENCQDQILKNRLAERLKYFISYFLIKDFLYNSSLNNENPIEKSMSTFYGYWSFLQALTAGNNVTENNSRKLSYFIKGFTSLYSNHRLDLSDNKFENINFMNIYFNFSTSLANVTFKNVEMTNSSIMGIYENRIEINYSNIAFSDLWSLSLNDTNIQEVIFRFSSIVNLALSHVRVIKSDFENTNIVNAQWQDTKFINCTFEDATFKNGFEDESYLCKLDFEECNFKNTIFKDIQFIDCNVTQESLEAMGAIIIDCLFR